MADPVLNFASTSSTVNQQIHSVALEVDLDIAGASDITLPFTVTGTSVLGQDYTITASPIIIPAGDTSTLIIINVINNAVNQSQHDVIVTLDTPTNATLGVSDTYTLTIDPDGIPQYPFLTPNQITDIGIQQPTVYFFSAVLQSDGTYTVQKASVNSGKLVTVELTNGFTKAQAKTEINSETASYIDGL